MTCRVLPWCLLVAVGWASGLEAARKPRREVTVEVRSTPADALISVHATATPAEPGPRTLAGTTPRTITVDLGESGSLWLELERRGYQPAMVEIGADSSRVEVELTPVEPAPASAAPRRLAVLEPEVSVIRRGFAAEATDEAASDALSARIAAALRARLETLGFEVATADAALAVPKALWRDARSAMAVVDPIRLPYLSAPPRLETRAGRTAVATLGSELGVDAVLLLTGSENLETGGMKAGKIGLSVAGTAASFGASYSAAVARGDSFFVYNVFVPTFAQGLALQAVLVDCASGELAWLDGGAFRPLKPDDDGPVEALAADLLAGLEGRAGGPEPEPPQEEPHP